MLTRFEIDQTEMHRLFNSAEIATFVHTVAGKAADEMSRTAPRGKGGEHLADHIETNADRDARGPYTEIGISAQRFFYWLFVDRGTEFMAARPFIKPALTRTYTI